jgi:TetR/AcrR family transcriptional regulator, fatty acid metabolism regulator protein
MELTTRQKDIMQAAMQIIARNGYKEFTTKNLARQMQLTEAALYRHFASKNELITTILQYFSSESKQVLDHLHSEESTPMERVKAFVMNRYHTFSSDPDLAQVMFSDELLSHDPSFAKYMQDIMHSHRDEVIQDIKEAQETGIVVKDLDPIQLFRIIIGSMRLLVSQWNFSGHSFDLVPEGEKLFETIKQMIEVKQ